MVQPIGPNPARGPVRVPRTWAELAGIGSGSVFRPVSTGNKAFSRRLNAYTVNHQVQAAVNSHRNRGPYSYPSRVWQVLVYGPGVPSSARRGSKGQSAQDLETDVVGSYFPRCGSCGYSVTVSTGTP